MLHGRSIFLDDCASYCSELPRSIVGALAGQRCCFTGVGHGLQYKLGEDKVKAVDLLSCMHEMRTEKGERRSSCPSLCQGLDPASRRNLWDVVRGAKAGRGIILTTHSMEEASALCDRLGIFVAGRLVCLGAPQELTARYGGYLVRRHLASSSIRMMPQGLSCIAMGEPLLELLHMASLQAPPLVWAGSPAPA